MSPDIVIAVATALIVLAGLGDGYRRGLTREAASFIGILLGMLLVEYWAGRWSVWLTARGMQANAARLVSELALIGGPALGGYGAGLLLRGPQSRRERGLGAGLGMLNAALLGALGVRMFQSFRWGETDPAQPVASWLRDALVTRYVLDYFALAVLLIGAVLVLIGLGAVLNRLVRSLAQRRAAAPRRQAPRPVQPTPPATPPATPAGPPSPPPSKTPPGQQEKFLE